MPRRASQTSQLDARKTDGGAAAIDRACLLLGQFGPENLTLSLAQLSQRTQMYKSTVLRAMASLEAANLVSRAADGQYQIGHEIARLHAIYLRSFRLDQLVRPVLNDLVGETGESAAYQVRQGAFRLCLYRQDCANPIRDLMREGDLMPLERGSGGRTFCAFDDTLKHLIDTASAALIKQITTVGYCAVDGDRRDGVAGISAPVWRADRKLAGVLTLSMPSHRYKKRHIKPVVIAAAVLSDRLVSTRDA